MRHPRHCLAHYQYFLQYHQRYSLQSATHASKHISEPSHAGTSTTSPSLPCHPRLHDNHVTQVSTPPTLAHYPCNYAIHTIHASTLACHPCKRATHTTHATHATHTSTYSTPFFKLCFYYSETLYRSLLSSLSPSVNQGTNKDNRA